MKIFLNDRTIEFTHARPGDLSPDVLVAEDLTLPGLNAAWYLFAGSDHYRRLIIPDPSGPSRRGPSAFDLFSTLFRLIYAAGGLVRNEKGEYLFIHRYGRWDLPKGKIDPEDIPPGPGHTVSDLPAARAAAVREVMEETGLERVGILRVLPATWHIYLLHEKYVIKKTQWFMMEAGSRQLLTPAAAEGITGVAWISPGAVPDILPNTYASIREFLAGVL